MTGEPDAAAAETGDCHEIEVLYTYGPHSEGAEFDEGATAFVIARDLRGFGTDAFDEFGRDPRKALDIAYDSLFECTVEQVDDVDELLREIYERLQGGRVDEQIGYDGSKTRSLGIGDVIRVDGAPYMVDRFGFTEIVFEREAEVKESDDGGILIADGGEDRDNADCEWSDYERGAIHALMEMSWHSTEFDITDFEGATTRFDNWREIVTEANQRWYDEFEDAAEDMEVDSE